MGTVKTAVRRKQAESAEQAPGQLQGQHDHAGHDHAGHDHSREEGLRVGAADDHYEVAADRAADAAVRRLAEGGQLGQSGQGFGQVPAAEKPIGAAGGQASGSTSKRINAARGGGDALPDGMRKSMEHAFGGANFSGVKIHSGGESAKLNSEVGAHAFTVGKDIFLGSSMPSLDSKEGQQTLAHELAHTLQPGGGARRLFGFGKKKDTTTGAQAPQETEPDSRTVTKDDKRGLAEMRKTDKHVKENESETGQNLVEMVNEGGESGPGATGDLNEYWENRGDTSKQVGNDTDASNLDSAGLAFSGFGLISGAADLITSWKEKDASERAEGVLDVAGNISDTGGAAADVGKDAIDSGKAGSSAAAEAASNIFGEITGILGTIKEGFGLVKNIVTAIKDGGDMEGKEKGQATVDIVKALLKTGAGVVSTINAFMSHLGTVSQAMIQAVPGLGVAMGVLDMITEGINIAYSYISWSEMRSDKRSKKGGIREKALEHFKTKFGNLAPAARKQKEVEFFGQELDEKDSSKSSGIRGFFGGHISGAKFVDYLKKNKPDELEKNEAEDYELNKGLQEVSAKRIRRAVLNLSAAVPGIAGDIATLSGVGAAVGTGLKAAGGGIKVLAVGVRMLKQKYHDVKGDSKSGANKLAKYNKMVDQMVDHILKVRGDESKQKAVEREVVASGMTMPKITAIVRDKGKDAAAKGKQLYKDWVEALKKR